MRMAIAISPRTIYAIYSASTRNVCRTRMPCKRLLICSPYNVPDTNKFFVSIYSFKCKRCVNNVQVKLPPVDSDCTSDLSHWYHCADNKGIPDDILKQAWDVTKCISFVFHHRSSAAEVKAEDAVEKVGHKKKRVYDEYDSDYEREPSTDGESNGSDEEYKGW